MTLNLAYAIADNSSAALAHLLETNRDFRTQPWPAPYDTTIHRLHLGDAKTCLDRKRECAPRRNVAAVFHSEDVCAPSRQRRRDQDDRRDRARRS